MVFASRSLHDWKELRISGLDTCSADESVRRDTLFEIRSVNYIKPAVIS